MLLGGVGRWKEQVQGSHWQKTEGDEQRRFQRLPNERLQLSVDDSELPISSFSIYIYICMWATPTFPFLLSTASVMPEHGF